MSWNSAMTVYCRRCRVKFNSLLNLARERYSRRMQHGSPHPHFERSRVSLGGLTPPSRSQLFKKIKPLEIKEWRFGMTRGLKMSDENTLRNAYIDYSPAMLRITVKNELGDLD